MKLSDISIIAWLSEYHIKTETGKPYDLVDHMFWFDILRDMHPKQVWLKAAQVGGSIAAIYKFLWCAEKLKMNVAYTLPTATDARDFVSGKIDPIIRNNPILQSYVDEKDSVEQKRIGQNTVYIRGTWTERAALSFSSDLNIHDELDRSKQSVVQQYASRQQHSPHKWEWIFSNPSSVGAGVDVAWQKSDQKEWIITCKDCKQKQILSWPDSVDLGREVYVCKACNQELSDRNRSVGYWNAMKPENTEWSGYHLSLLMAPWTPASYIVEMYRTKSPEYFHNFVLGLPYEGLGGRLSEAEFMDNLDDTPYAIEAPIVIGLDTGLPNWYVVGGNQGLWSAGKCDGYDDIRQMLDRWPKSVVVSDQGGDLHGIRQLQEDYPGRVFLCYYRMDRKTMQLVTWGKGDESGKVVADRNRIIQLVMDEFKAKSIPLKGNQKDWWEAWTHYANVYRVTEEDSVGQERFVYQRSGADHLVHAISYWRIGMDKFGMSQAGSVKPDTEFMRGIGSSYAIDPMVGGMPANAFRGVKPPKDWRDV